MKNEIIKTIKIKKDIVHLIYASDDNCQNVLLRDILLDKIFSNNSDVQGIIIKTTKRHGFKLPFCKLYVIKEIRYIFGN